MTSSEILIDCFGRIREVVHGVVDGLTPDQLAQRVGPEANSIAWLMWHLTRVQDDHVAGVRDMEQLWTSKGWMDRFGFPFEPQDTGWSHSPEQVAAVRVDSGDLLIDYYDAVHDETIAYLRSLTDEDMGRVVDERWDPPVTLGVRLVSVVNDDLQHAGQAAYVRGLITTD